MKLRFQTKASQPITTTILPPELRLMILEELASHDEKHHMASWASVSKEWQSFFEPLLWQTLTFRPSISRSGFLGFHRFIKGYRKSLVKKIRLHVRMEEYACEQCDRLGGPDRNIRILKRNKTRFSASLEYLFHFLADWTGETSGTGITLELGAIWTSGSHCLHSQSPRYSPTSPWLRSLSKLCLDRWIPLPKAPIITGLSFDQTLRQSISASLILSMLESLPCLKQANYESQLIIEQLAPYISEAQKSILFQ
ncbi:uncharacterized protein LY79DRAFT_562949 [Colletotrichum navitas]|uniref:F-box domain-containing protein n=1 Tax=Colletotrichum navitas TaxID=681940 RepID=A0AAD8PTY4_9PEZI|nr:uncharacterized protein LY79DRAFT_562949 [Colletotrichum navitas]KAK1579962.1 hypothetical protein LY79DRAFT_562949 [Colletotrichum navitas]